MQAIMQLRPLSIKMSECECTIYSQSLPCGEVKAILFVCLCLASWKTLRRGGHRCLSISTQSVEYIATFKPIPIERTMNIPVSSNIRQRPARTTWLFEREKEGSPNEDDWGRCKGCFPLLSRTEIREKFVDSCGGCTAKGTYFWQAWCWRRKELLYGQQAMIMRRRGSSDQKQTDKKPNEAERVVARKMDGIGVSPILV
eukprot:Gb_41037 [translate_table: standard]